MKITNGRVVSLDYRLHLGDGDIIDESLPADPFVYMHGSGQIVPGLERSLEGLVVGDERKVVVEPGDGYGEYQPDGLQEIPRDAFPREVNLEIGQQFEARSPKGETFPMIVKELRRESIVVDLNHPLAGRTLHFDVRVLSIRDATPAELSHGHAHGPHGGHEH
jgi:FKBP-type peptidyl-prolyl cis-trans isomerase SlyD